MTLISALVFTYLVIGLTVGIFVASAQKMDLPGKLGRDMLKLEKQMMDRGQDPSIIPLLMMLLWPMIFVVNRNK